MINIDFLHFEKLRTYKAKDLQELGIIVHWASQAILATCECEFHDLLYTEDPNMQLCRYAYQLITEASNMLESAGENSDKS